MHRFVNLKFHYLNYWQTIQKHTTFSPTGHEKFQFNFCSYCQNTLKNHLNNVPGLNIISRNQSTRALLIQRTARKKKKTRYPKKYVELLEVNDEAMKQTKAAVSTLKAAHLSKLAANPEMSLGELHKLKSPAKKKKNVGADLKVDLELLREIECSILNKYRRDEHQPNFKEDDCAIIFASECIPNIQVLQNESGMRLIKDSYDKFRRETVRDQKMKDIISAINEGVNPNLSFITDEKIFSDSDNNSNQHLNSKGAHEVFREYLSERKQLFLLDAIESDNIDQLAEFDTKETHPLFEELDNEFHENTLKDSLILENIQSLPSQPGVVEKEKTKSKKTKASSSVKLKTKTSMKLHNDSLAKQQFEKMQLIGKEKNLVRILSSHLEICLATGFLDKAHQLLKYYRLRGKKKDHPPITDVKLYNILLHGFAANGNYNTISDILQNMKDDSISLSTQSFAAIFECIEVAEMNDKYDLLDKYRAEMNSQGITLNDLMDKCKFTKHQHRAVLSAVRRLEPNFTPVYSKPDFDYNCSLLLQLNNSLESQMKGSRSRLSSPAEGVLDIKALKEKTLKQIKNEIAGTIEIKNIEVKGKPSQHVVYCRNKLQTCEQEWRDTMEKAFVRNLATLKAQCKASHLPVNIYPYFNILEVNELVELMISEIRKIALGSETFSPAVRSLHRELGVKIFSKYLIKKKVENGVMDKVLEVYEKYCDWYINRFETDKPDELIARRKWQQLVHENRGGVSLDMEETEWPRAISVSLGKFLYNILLNDVKIDVDVLRKNAKKPKYMPLLYSIYRNESKMRFQEIKPHPMLIRLLKESVPPTLHMDTVLVPSLSPPMPWIDIHHGGYLLSKTYLMRIISGATHQFSRLEEAPLQSLYPSLDSLNQLGSIPWSINQPVLDILLQVFRSGGSRELSVARPASAAPLPPPASASLPRKERALVLRQRALLARSRQELHSLWCDSLYKLSLANHYRDEVFWLPHNMDFRGRVYPCPPHLSHLGSDTSRALMIFARGKPLGPGGMRWLKLHCVNLTGTMKKNTIDERYVYAEKILDDILDSADKPLDGRRWWVESEDPWQTLACCIEISKAVRSPDPEKYICHFPVHQDGSCNGLQHYAALGGDRAGGFSVNLSPADRPQDVYSAVVNLVEAARSRDAENGISIAKELEGFVQRKVIKQTVMTTVYGVTRFGARLQIAKRLKENDNFPKEHVWSASSYLTGKTFESIQEMFTSTKLIQDWFTECAKLIAGICHEKVEWVTPLGLPVVQPYHKPSKAMFSARGNLTEYTSCDQFEQPCIIKQKNAFPPNFIHSLDSSHMMLTSIHSEMNDITFVSVHDCFWTHPCSVPVMNKICREQFVALHSEPILESLSEYLQEKFSIPDRLVETGSVRDTSVKKLNNVLKHLPKKGDFNLKNVLNSVYFFS